MTATKTLNFSERMKVFFTGKLKTQEQSLRTAQTTEKSIAIRPFNVTENRDVKRGEIAIEYKPGLINELKAEHEVMLEMFNSIVTNVMSGQAGEMWSFELAGVTLTEFHQLFLAHIIKENTYMWAFLKKPQFKGSFEDAKDLHRSVLSIQSRVNRFCERYKGNINASNADEFLEGFIGLSGEGKQALLSQKKSLGAVLQGRIETEEAIPYMLYETLGIASQI